MAQTLKEKLAAKKAAEAAAKKDGAPAGPKLGTTLSEPPQREVAEEVREEPKTRAVPPSPPQPQAREEPAEVPSEPPTPAPSPVAKVVVPRTLRPVLAPKAARPPPTPEEEPAAPPKSKATAPLGTMAGEAVDNDRESTPAEEVGSGELEISSGSSALPASLRGLDLSALDEPEEKEEKAPPAPAPPAPVKSNPPNPAADPKIQRRQRNFVEGEEQPLSQGFSLEHVESAGVAEAKFVLKGHGVEREIILTRRKAASVKVETDDGDYSLNLLYKERNDEGALVVHSEIKGESGMDKAKNKTAKAAKAAGSAVSNLRYFVPEMISAAFVPAWSIVLATRDWFKQFNESHSNWPMVGVYSLIAVQIAITVWSAISRKKKLANGKVE